MTCSHPQSVMASSVRGGGWRRDKRGLIQVLDPL